MELRGVTFYKERYGAFLHDPVTNRWELRACTALCATGVPPSLCLYSTPWLTRAPRTAQPRLHPLILEQ